MSIRSILNRISVLIRNGCWFLALTASVVVVIAFSLGVLSGYFALVLYLFTFCMRLIFIIETWLNPIVFFFLFIPMFGLLGSACFLGPAFGAIIVLVGVDFLTHSAVVRVLCYCEKNRAATHWLCGGFALFFGSILIIGLERHRRTGAVDESLIFIFGLLFCGLAWDTLIFFVFVLTGAGKLCEAYKAGNTERIFALLKLGAPKDGVFKLATADISNRDHRNSDLIFPLHRPASVGELDTLMRNLKTGVDVNQKDINGQTPLHFAAGYSDTQVCLFLIENGANMNEKDQNGKTPLHCAALSNKNPQVCELLISKGANANENDNAGESPLFSALSNTEEVCELLIRNGARIDATNLGGSTLLHAACSTFKPSIVSLLLQHGADVNQKDKDGKTPLRELLIFAVKSEASSKRTEIFQLCEQLLMNGADVNQKDKYGNNSVLQLVFLCIAPPRLDLFFSFCELLLKYGANLNEPNSGGIFPLCLALFSCRFSIFGILSVHSDFNVKLDFCQFLLKNGASVHQKYRGKNLLISFLIENNLQAAELLLEYGADANERDTDGNTPLLSFLGDRRIIQPQNFTSVCELLLKHGARNVQNVRGQTPLSIARNSDKPLAVRLLSEMPMPSLRTLCFDQSLRLRPDSPDLPKLPSHLLAELQRSRTSSS
eukprot:TRINITY_DN2438_c0_g1_i1.p1 TRINITY_DN2438_c0_g1~~TRINITY_DN2438_c0_g1_i1.p1  ORF type:complete len:770 (+),score=158.14 TRINITY_DN2438_c0_g1_i1:335-2311(+)